MCAHRNGATSCEIAAHNSNGTMSCGISGFQRVNLSTTHSSLHGARCRHVQTLTSPYRTQSKCTHHPLLAPHGVSDHRSQQWWSQRWTMRPKFHRPGPLLDEVLDDDSIRLGYGEYSIRILHWPDNHWPTVVYGHVLKHQQHQYFIILPCMLQPQSTE